MATGDSASKIEKDIAFGLENGVAGTPTVFINGERVAKVVSSEQLRKGTVLERRMKCGKPGCACHTDRSKRHGPYWEWTYKANGKTVNVRLSPHAGPIYKAASQQYRKLKSLLTRLQRLSRTTLASAAKKAD